MLKYHQLFFAVLAAVAVTSNAKSDFVPLAPVGNVAAVQSTTQSDLGDTRLYYQGDNGAILQADVSGPFTSGTSTTPSVGIQIAPADEAMFGTPIAACEIDSGDTAYSEVCVHTIQSVEILIQLYTLGSCLLLLSYQPAARICLYTRSRFPRWCKLLYLCHPVRILQCEWESGFVCYGRPEH